MILIDADQLREEWLENGENDYIYDINSFLYSIDSQPIIDPETLPIVQELREQLKKVTAERDAAVADLSEACDCETCKNTEYSMMNAAIEMSNLIHCKKEKEKWTAEWLNFYGDYSTAECSNCGELCEVSPDEEPKKEIFDAFKKFYKFCPSCGKAMTEEAWEEVKNRLQVQSNEMDKR